MGGRRLSTRNYRGRSLNSGRRKRKAQGILRLLVIAICVIAVIALLLTLVVKLFGGGEDALKAESQSVEQKVEKQYNIPPAGEENDLLKIATTAVGSDKKICYLTFDDGPTKEVTPKVLEVLKKYNVKATFFSLGKMLDANRDIAKQEYDEGHLIANHSYYHNYNELYATSKSFMDEVTKTENTIRDITGEEPFKLIRFPGGSYNAGDHAAEKQTYKKVLQENGYYYADWNCLNGDAEASLRSVDELVAKVKSTATSKNIVVLMHDAAAKTTTPEALGQIIEYLRAQGYEFKRLDEVQYYDDGSSDVDADSMIL